MKSEIMNQYNLKIKEYSNKDITEWDNFVNKSNNGTIFHLQTFLQYHKKDKFNFTCYMIYNNDELVAVLPGGYKDNGDVYWSPLGASYGSLVTKNLHFDISLAIVDAVLDFFKKQGTKDVFFIPPPLIYSKIYNQNIEYSMLYRKFDFEYHYISHALDLSLKNEKYYNRSTRFKLKKVAQNNNLVILQRNDFEAFYPILVDNKLKHNAMPTHSLEDLIKLDNLLPDKLKLFIAYYKNIPIGGFLVFLTNKNVSLCFYNAMDYDYKKLYPAYALVDYVINWSRNNGYKWFDFGVSQDTTSDNPMAPSLSLIDFKENFFTRGIFRSTYHISMK